jgi:hypothetical protein
VSQSIPQTETSAYKSLLYWRKNVWNGSACVPVILTLEDDTLMMKDDKEVVVFQAPISQVSKRFTQWGTMILEVGSKKYDIVGMPAQTSPAITDAQKAELSGLSDGSQGEGLMDSKPVTLGSAATDGVGGAAQTITRAASSTIAYYRGLATMSEWKALIGSKSDQQIKMNAMTYYIVGVIVILVIFILLKP